MNLNTVAEAKKKLRGQMRRLRRDNIAGHRDAHEKLGDVFMRCISLPANAVISGYCAFGDEMNPAPLLDLLRRQGHIITLPRVVGKNRPLSFHRYEPGDALFANAVGIAEPLSGAPVLAPDVMLVPVLAFDAARNRLGYGGGFYDRTIAALCAEKRVLTIGIGYGYQQVPEIPTEAHDVRLDKIVTELDCF